tara:strand:- start:34424 stop:35083 length:660 start_codon:yes stop_codon:yes gene_type:complete
MPKRPTRARRSQDRVLVPDGHETRHQITIDMMLAPLDRLQDQLDRKWGINRLPAILPADPPPHVPAAQHEAYRSIGRRYGEAVEALNVAIAENDADGVQAGVERVSKALRVMDRQCDAAGVEPPSPLVWEIDLDGRRIAIVHETADWERVKRERPAAEIYSLRDAAVALTRMSLGTALLGEVKRQFPGAELGPLRPKREAGSGAMEDPIPFGNDEPANA